MFLGAIFSIVFSGAPKMTFDSSGSVAYSSFYSFISSALLNNVCIYNAADIPGITLTIL